MESQESSKESNASYDSLEPLPGFRERTVVMRAMGLTKVYPAVAEKGGAGRGALELFRGLDLRVHAGEMVAIVGRVARARVRCYICWLRWILRRRVRFGVGKTG